MTDLGNAIIDTIIDGGEVAFTMNRPTEKAREIAVFVRRGQSEFHGEIMSLREAQESDRDELARLVRLANKELEARRVKTTG